MRGHSVPHLVAAGVLTLGLVGDAVIYAVLPAAAAAYGLGPAGVAAALSVNRFARLVLNPLAALSLARVGLRRGAFVGSALATLSTAAYAVAPGAAALLAARIAWGAAFATLRLTVQGYATHDPPKAARRLGHAAALQELAPAALLLVGSAALAPLGVRGLFAVLAGLTALSLPLAWLLPPAGASAREAVPARGSPDAWRVSMARPASMAAAVAFGVDGVLTAGVVLAWIAVGWDPLDAARIGAGLLAAKKVGQVALASIAGAWGERCGVHRVVRYAAVSAAVGLTAMAAAPLADAALFAGTVIAMLSGTVVATLMPAVLGGGDTAERLGRLGRLANARDLGAAVGAAAGPLLLVGGQPTSVAWVFGTAAAVVLASAAVWRAPAAVRVRVERPTRRVRS